MLIQIIGLIYLIRKTVRTCQNADIRATKFVFAVIGIYVLITIFFLFVVSYLIQNGNLAPTWTQFPLNLILACISVLVAGLCSNILIKKIEAPETTQLKSEFSDNEELLDD